MTRLPVQPWCQRGTYFLAAVTLLAACWIYNEVRAQAPGAHPPGAVVKPDNTGRPEAAEQPPAGLKEAIPTRNLLGIMRDGGLLMYPIAFCSFLLVAFTLERAISLRRARVIPKPFVTRFLHQMRQGDLDREQALTLCEENGSPVAEVFAGAVRKWGRPGVEIEQAIIDSGERVTNGLRRHLRVINAISTISPLLGLLGTVTGIIRAFNAIATEDALGRPDRLASGISEALLTTAFGLFVAIPASACYLFFVSRVDGLIVQIDALGQEIVNTISAEELQEKKPRTPKVRRIGQREPVA